MLHHKADARRIIARLAAAEELREPLVRRDGVAVALRHRDALHLHGKDACVVSAAAAALQWLAGEPDARAILRALRLPLPALGVAEALEAAAAQHAAGSDHEVKFLQPWRRSDVCVHEVEVLGLQQSPP